MKRLFTITLIMLMALLMFLLPLGMQMPTTQAQALSRLSAEFKHWNAGSEAQSSVTALPDGQGGTEVYRKTVFVPTGTMTVYLTISATGDAHRGNAILFSALLDGTPFNNGAGGAVSGLPNGWIALQKHFDYDNVTYNGGDSGGDGGGGNGDMHDNGIYYTWCKKVGPGSHLFTIRMATTGLGADSSVFFEKAYFYIDASPICACMEATNQ